MKKERLEELKKIHEDEGTRIFCGEVDELFAEIERLRESFQSIKDMENDFYSVVTEGLNGGEIRRLNPLLSGYGSHISVIYGTVNEALNPKFT